MPEVLSGLLLKKSFEFLHRPAGEGALVQRLRIAFFHQKDDVVLRLRHGVDQFIAKRGGGDLRNDGIGLLAERNMIVLRACQRVFTGDHAIESVLKQQNGQQHHLYQQGSHRTGIKRKRLSVEWDQQQCVDEKDAPAENGPKDAAFSPQHLAHRAGSYGHRSICDITVNFKSHVYSPL